MPAVAIYHGRKNISGENVAAALERLTIPFEMITARDIASGKLSRYSCVIFPGGHSIVLGKSAEKQVLPFVKSGGGFIGICAGCQFGVKLGILPVQHKILRATGIFDMRIVAKHPVSAGYAIAGKHSKAKPWTYSSRGRVRIRYANGGMLTAGRGARVIVSFDEHGDFGAVVTGNYGRGKVVLITPHPESTPPAPRPPQSDSDKSQEPFSLFANAVKFCSVGITGT